MSQERIYPVSAVNAYVKRLLTMDPLLSDIGVVGEISNFKRHTSGHLYLTLKDQGGAISAVMFAQEARRLRFIPANGDKVIARGYLSLYEKTGQYQLYIRSMEKEGSGDLFQAFEYLKRKLESEGLFDPAHKKPIPAFPRKIGIVTSPTGAALRDVIKVARRRFPGVELVVYPALVQGTDAADTIVRGIRVLDRIPEVETIIVCRGGGSIEDLWPFNEEAVARAIYAASTPVISGVGHETDFTIADFVSDLRAPTPSAAAELAVFDYSHLMDQFLEKEQRIQRACRVSLTQRSSNLAFLAGRLQLLSPGRRLRDHQLDLDRLRDQQKALLDGRMQVLSHRLEKLGQALDLGSPVHQMEKGYAFVTGLDGSLIGRTDQMKVRDEVRIRMIDGSMEAGITKITKESWMENE